MFRAYKLLNQNNKFLGMYSRLDDALKAIKILMKKHKKIKFQIIRFNGEITKDGYLIDEIEIV